MRITKNWILQHAMSMATDEEVLEKSIGQINFDDDKEEEMLPRYMYRYTL